MEYEHNTVGALLKNMEDTMAPHQLAETGCTTLKTIKKSFDYLRIEIHKHIHMENYILHPLARSLE
jgi:regulator of cell morphogenesis and NO signaling